jgi:zinc D-Ala-D-Ala carboxypeptidase
MRALTDHFTIEEMTVSRRAAVLGIDNTPSPAIRANLVRVARVLEYARGLLGYPITVTSGYRSPQLNAITPGSAKNSAHMQGLAADIIAPLYGPPLAVAERLIGDASFMANVDQLIFEFASWVHVGLAPEGVTPRRQVLSKLDAGPYLVGLHKPTAVA